VPRAIGLPPNRAVPIGNPSPLIASINGLSRQTFRHGCGGSQNEFASMRHTFEGFPQPVVEARPRHLADLGSEFFRAEHIVPGVGRTAFVHNVDR
jgi:hypothetical protein